MLSDSEVPCPGFFLKLFPLCQLQIFIMFFDLASDRFKAFYSLPCNLVHEQTTLSPT